MLYLLFSTTYRGSGNTTLLCTGSHLSVLLQNISLHKQAEPQTHIHSPTQPLLENLILEESGSCSYSPLFTSSSSEMENQDLFFSNAHCIVIYVDIKINLNSCDFELQILQHVSEVAFLSASASCLRTLKLSCWFSWGGKVLHLLLLFVVWRKNTL